MAWSKLSRHQRGYDNEWVKLRRQIIARDNGLCQACLTSGRPTPFAAVDHIVPKAKGGTDHPDNLQCLCGPCHEAKTQAEAAEAQGRAYTPKRQIGLDGW
ncbi:MAG: HNH endonuclease, partial [Rhodobacteraceae bacterium]|nr:HNH endonuclease [Paracoccaceae bacterium]